RPRERRDIPLEIRLEGTLGFGSGKDKPCSEATEDEIADCIMKRPYSPLPYDDFLNNCHTDVMATLEACCLTGWWSIPARAPRLGVLIPVPVWVYWWLFH